MSHHCRTPQKIIPIAVVPKNNTIDLMYSGSPKKRCNMQHIAAVFAPVIKKTTTIVQISCSDYRYSSKFHSIRFQVKINKQIRDKRK